MDYPDLVYGSADAPFGGETIKITINSVEIVYIIQGSWSPKFATREVAKNNEQGSQTDMSLWAEPSTISLTLLLGTRTTPVPHPGVNFKITYQGQEFTYVVTSCSPVRQAGEAWSVSIEAKTPTYAVLKAPTP